MSLQSFLLLLVRVGKWVPGVIHSTFSIVIWFAIGIGVLWGFLAFGHAYMFSGGWWIAAIVVVLFELGVVVNYIAKALQGFVLPGAVTGVHGHASFAQIRDVKRSGIWRA